MVDMGTARVVSCRECGTRNRIWPGKAASHPEKVICGGCKEGLFLPLNAPLSGIATAAYEHPLDRKALNLMRKVPGVNTVLRFLLKELSERRLRMLVQQANLKVTPNHLTPLYNMVEDGARALDLADVPELFVSNDPMPNAFAIGVDNPFIVLTTSLLDTLNEEEIKGVIGHELGHIHAGHQLYRTALYMIVQFADMSLGSMVPLRDSALKAIYYALLYWDRCSELTADRAQMLVQRNFEGFVTCEMKMAGGCKYTNSMLDVDAFLAQAEEALEMQEEHFLNRMYASIQNANTTHPYPVWRVGHMQKWVYEGDYLDIIMGNYPLRTTDWHIIETDGEAEEDRKSVPDTIKEMLSNWRKQF